MRKSLTKPGAARRKDGRRNVLGVIVLLLAASMVALTYVWYVSRAPLDRVAEDVIDAVLHNNPDLAYDRSFDFQKRALGISRDTFREMWRQLIAPRIAGLRVVKPTESFTERGGHQGVSYAVVRDRDDNEFELVAFAWATEEGGKIDIMHFLRDAWRCEYLYRRGKQVGPETNLEALIEGVEHDMSILQELGIRGFPPHLPGEPMRTWEESLRSMKSKLVELRSREG